MIETQLPLGERYVPNDVYLDTQKQQIMMITGPNMAGKSALLRQTALIVLLAQVGCFVPAERAKIGLVDKILTRVGASDNLSLGESTFMVEMTEASDILNNVSSRSLVLFDELGRGTSTYDGISIAWAIVEYLHEQPKARARTLFATHYHELNEMEKNFSRIKNYNVSVKEVDGKVIFLRKLMKGGSEYSCGRNSRYATFDCQACQCYSEGIGGRQRWCGTCRQAQYQQDCRAQGRHGTQLFPA